jgi:hypothetical protein
MSRATAIALTLVFCTGGVTLAFAGATNEPASIAFHISEPSQKAVCNVKPVLTAQTIVHRVDVGQNCTPDGTKWVWLLVCNASDSLGIAGMELGIEYGDGIVMNGWTRCTDLEFPQFGWPASGTGNILTWNPGTNCQDQMSEPYVPGSVIAVAGAFSVTIYAPEQLISTPRPVSGRAKVADCNAAETDITDYFPSHLGIAGFCEPGYNPCNAPTPVRETSWGRIKAAYGN